MHWDKYSRMHHFVAEMCIRVHISDTKLRCDLCYRFDGSCSSDLICYLPADSHWMGCTQHYIRITGPLCGQTTGERWFSSQRSSKLENIYISWRHHGGSSFVAVSSCWDTSHRMLHIVQSYFTAICSSILPLGTKCILVTATFDSVCKCRHNWFRQWLDAEQIKSHHLNQC